MRAARVSLSLKYHHSQSEEAIEKLPSLVNFVYSLKIISEIRLFQLNESHDNFAQECENISECNLTSLKGDRKIIKIETCCAKNLSRAVAKVVLNKFI